MLKSVNRRLLLSSSLSKGIITSTIIGTAIIPVGADAVEKKALPTVTVEANAPDDIQGYKANTLSSPKYSQPLRDVPQSVTVVPGEVLEERGATSLKDAVRNVTGITIAAGEGGTPNGDNLTIRGFSARTDIFIDGVRDIGGYFRDSFNMEQVEVVKGPNSAASGRGSTGGSINLVNKSAKLENFANADLTIGTDNLYRATADVNHRIEGREGAAIRLNAMAHSENVAGRDEAENRRFGFSPSLSFGLGTETELTLSYLHQEEDNLPDYGVPYSGGLPANVNRNNFYGFLGRDFEDTQADIGTVELNHEITDDLSLRNVTRYGRTMRENIVTPPRDPDFAANTINREGRNRDSVDTILVNQTDVTKKFNTAKVTHTLVTGFEVARETSQNTRLTITDQTGNSLVHPNPYDPFTGTITFRDRTDTTADAIAVYVFDTLELNKKWELNGGLRWDHFNAETDISGNTHLEQSDAMLSWRAGAVYKPQENGSIYLSYGTSFNPSAEALALSTTTGTLDPEESETYELGTKWDLLKEKLSVTSAIFRTLKKNALTDAGTGTPSTLDGEQQVDGFEIGVTGAITDKLNVIAGYTHLDSKIESSRDATEVGKKVNRVADNSVSLWTTYQLMPAFQVGGGASYVSSRYSDDANTRKIPGYITYDAMASYDLSENVSLRINGINLADEDYYDSVGGGHVIPGRGRTFMLTTGLKF